MANPPISEQQALEQLNRYTHIIETAPRDSTEFFDATKAYNQLLHPTINIRDLVFLGKNLDHSMTNTELAKLIIAARNDQDLSDVLDINEDARVAYKFKHLRQAKHMTQQEVAAKSKNYTQSQIAQAELGQLSLSPSRWQALFETLGMTAHFVIA
ncbi:helix-turn-helix domain-containing protein [Secundilactobacillus similis]|nr:helix-turn-helix transcriptional regulator [Secundilactobacillus similis]